MTNFFRKTAGCLILFGLIFLFSYNVCANELVYTIQTGSFVSEDDAGKQFDRVVKELHGEELDDLRIEKIGNFYSLRLGRFQNRALAEKLFIKVKNKFSSAIVMNAYIKEERVIRNYNALSLDDQDKAEEKTVVNQPFPPGLIYTIQTGSFANEKAAQKQFDFIMKKLQTSELDYVRIEAIGKYYCVRIGNFEKRASADSTYKTVRDTLPNAVIMDAYIKEQRIVKMFRNDGFSPLKAEKEKPTELKEGSAESKFTMNETPVPDLFFNGKKPPINENLKRKIRPNSERKGDMYVEKKQYFRALEQYRQARYKRPILRRKMAVLLYRMGFVEESISELEAVVELSPNISADRMMLGTLYLANGKSSKAKEQFIEALEINPGETYAYCYLAELYLKESDYDMAWLSVKMSQKLGYKGDELVNRLRSLSPEPAENLWSITEDGLSLRLILVNTYGQAANILDRIKEGELFESIAATESFGPGRNAGGFMGRLNPSEVVSEILSAMNNQDAFSAPVIVKTRNGYHIVQKIMSFDMSEWRKILADSRKTDLLTSNAHK